MDSGNVDAACASFAESQRLDPGGGTLLNLAVCHEAQGKTATAWSEFAAGLGQARRDARTDRIELAEQHMTALEPRLVRLLVNVQSFGGLRVARDGQPLPHEVWGVAVPIDPGEHRVEAFDGGARVFLTTVAISPEPGTTTTVAVAPEPIDRAPEVVEAPTRTSANVPEAESRSSWRPVLGWSLLGAGALGIGAGTFFGLRAFDERGASDDQCIGGRCTTGAVTSNDNAKAAADLSTAGFTIGAVLAVAGACLLLLPTPRPSRAAR
jgi:hypothetical protein